MNDFIQTKRSCPTAPRRHKCWTISTTCSISWLKRPIYKNINELSFLFLHERWTHLSYYLYMYVHMTALFGKLFPVVLRIKIWSLWKLFNQIHLRSVCCKYILTNNKLTLQCLLLLYGMLCECVSSSCWLHSIRHMTQSIESPMTTVGDRYSPEEGTVMVPESWWKHFDPESYLFFQWME